VGRTGPVLFQKKGKKNEITKKTDARIATWGKDMIVPGREKTQRGLSKEGGEGPRLYAGRRFLVKGRRFENLGRIQTAPKRKGHTLKKLRN